MLTDSAQGRDDHQVIMEPRPSVERAQVMNAIWIVRSGLTWKPYSAGCATESFV